MATRTVDIQEAQQHLADLVDQIADGTEIVLLDGQVPRARLVPIAPRAVRRIPGLHAGCITASFDFDETCPDFFGVSDDGR